MQADTKAKAVFHLRNNDSFLRICAGALLVCLLSTVRSDAQNSANIAPVGAVYSWGNNSYGQLGNGANGIQRAPVQVNFLTAGATVIVEGSAHSLAIRNGAAFAWGSNGYGQLGNGNTNESNVPTLVSNMGSGVTAVAATVDTSLIVQNGAAFTCGGGYGAGELGNGTTGTSVVPVAVSGLSNGVTTVSGGYNHFLAIQNGTVYAWGSNDQGQLGNGRNNNSSVPVVVSLGSGVTSVAGGNGYSLAIKNGAVYAWGSNTYGTLGNGSENGYSYYPLMVSGLSDGVTAVAGGGIHCLAVRNGYVYAWGYNNTGQLGNGTQNKSLTPIQIDPTDLNHVIAVAATAGTSYALKDDGTIWAWGDGSYGQLGNGAGGTYNFYQSTPQRVSPAPGAFYLGLFQGGTNAVHASAIEFVPPSTFFNDETYLGNGVFYMAFANGYYFGYFGYLNDPNTFYHFDLGYEGVTDANDGSRGVYFYDYASNTYFYTSPTYSFPYMYDFTLKAVLYYYPDSNQSGHYTKNPRYFYNFSTNSIITK